jgi:catechol 2,3-dioxygenase
MRTPAFGDVAHLGHVELLTPEFDKSRWFFTELLAMREVAAEGDSVFLHAWDDYERYTIKLTSSRASGVGRVALRAASREALERRVAAIETSGRGVGWKDGEQGVGASYAFTDPDGHPMEIYYDTEWFEAPAGAEPALKNQADKFPGRGINARRLDHV